MKKFAKCPVCKKKTEMEEVSAPFHANLHYCIECKVVTCQPVEVVE